MTTPTADEAKLGVLSASILVLVWTGLSFGKEVK